ALVLNCSRLGSSIAGTFWPSTALMKNWFAWAAWISLSAKLRTAGVGLKSYLSSGKSSAIAISLRPMSFHCASTASDALGAGFGAASFFGISWVYVGVTRIPAARITTASTPTLSILIAYPSTPLAVVHVTTICRTKEPIISGDIQDVTRQSTPRLTTPAILRAIASRSAVGGLALACLPVRRKRGIDAS